MARGKPTDWIADSALLVDAAAYRAHILRIEPEALFE
jgi:glycine cleavage system H protein